MYEGETKERTLRATPRGAQCPRGEPVAVDQGIDKLDGVSLEVRTEERVPR
ncbi:hypothetical protein [Streptomyces sp. NPDC021212]|uniref:hypothetical protein n=1 Tax=Streptomyces sp. NPDC021212 TaxID=3365118 RepID=UPI0037A7AA48